MSTANIRKIVTVVDEIHVEMGRAIDPPTRRAAACAVIANPCATAYVEDLEPLMAIGAELGGLLGERAVRGARDRTGGCRELRQGRDRRGRR